MHDNSSNSKRIAKNTFLLYLRTFLVMLVSIYTSRVVLQALGVEDYGIYQVVGGVVSMFAMISNALSAAISRFITFEIGSCNKERQCKVFSTSRVTLLVIAVIVLVLTEVVGMWFVRTQMQIPDGRMPAAIWVLQFSVIAFCISLIVIPYTSCVIAHEHMKVFAYISIAEAFMKLGICFLLLISPFDRLITYAALLSIVSLIILLTYSIYCHRNFEESNSPIRMHRSIFKEMFGFAGWSFFTSATSVFKSQGVDMLINVYFGVVFNAARGLANQVKNALVQFISSFVTAINPQITKSYAAGDITGMHVLVCRGARFSYYLTLVMFVPIFFESDYILYIWLTEVPEKTALFVRLALISILLDGAGYTSYTANLATGRIKKYSIVLSLLTAAAFPLTWIVYANGGNVEAAYYIAIITNIFYHIARMFLTQENVGLSVRVFLKEVYYPIIKTTLIAIIPSILVFYLMEQSFARFVISLLVGVGSSAGFSLLLGMTKNERELIISKAKSILTNFFNKNHSTRHT